MRRRLLSMTTSIILLAGCSVAREPGSAVQADQADITGDATQQLQQENTISRVQTTTRVVADTPPPEQGIAESVPETHTTVSGDAQENAVSPHAQTTTQLVADTPPSEQGITEHVPEIHTTVSGDPQENPVSPRAQITTRVVADTPPPEQGIAEPISEIHTTVYDDPQEKAKRRDEMIKGVVARALADIPPENDPPLNIRPNSEKPPPDRQRSRRKQLQDVVVNVRPSTASQGDTYIAELNEEVTTTVVIDEEGARLPAVTAPRARSNRSIPQPVSNEDFLVYTVQSGDSLWAIAEYFYGDGFRYTDIFKANRDLIEHTNLLEIGQPLRIPRHGTIRRRSTF